MSYRRFADVAQNAKVFGDYIVEHNATLRQTAEKFKCSKSFVHQKITTELIEIDVLLYSNVRKVLEKNKRERHIRGGMANKKRCQILAELKLRNG